MSIRGFMNTTAICAVLAGLSAGVWAEDKVVPLAGAAATETPILAGKLIGSAVRDSAGQKIGAVDDLLIGPDHRIEQFVISVGGFLGLGDKLVALPVSEFRTHRDGLILAGATRESLEVSPAFNKASFASTTPIPPRIAPAQTSDVDRLRSDYQAKMDDWNRKIGDYRDKAADSADQTKEKVRRSLDSAWEKARAQWSEFKDATAETYDSAKAKLDRAIQDLDRSWQETTG